MKVTVRARQDGSLNIPKLFRSRLGIQPGTLVTISQDSQQRIYLKPHTTTCYCCGDRVPSISLATGMCQACEQLCEFYVREGHTIKDSMRLACKSAKENK